MVDCDHEGFKCYFPFSFLFALSLRSRVEREIARRAEKPSPRLVNSTFEASRLRLRSLSPPPRSPPTWIEAIQCDSSEPDACDQGCNGGLMTTAFEYLLKAGGLEREKDYPYTGRDRGTCKFDKSKIAAKVSNFSVVSIIEDQIAANLVKHGPLAIGINAVFMQTYIGGVSCPYICMHRLDHGVLLVGYGSAGFAPIRLKEKPYWIIKNSWGERWGEDGYYKICRGHNICGVDSMVSTVAAVHINPDVQV